MTLAGDGDPGQASSAGGGRADLRGVRLGIDVGSVRVGVAMSDPNGILATPVGTFQRNVATGSDVARIADLVAEHAVVEVIVGLPRSLSGREGAAVDAARAYGAVLQRRIGSVPVRYVDERLTSVTANRILAERGRSAKKSRAVVDQVAAVQILQHYLDSPAVREQRW